MNDGLGSKDAPNSDLSQLKAEALQATDRLRIALAKRNRLPGRLSSSYSRGIEGQASEAIREADYAATQAHNAAIAWFAAMTDAQRSA